MCLRYAFTVTDFEKVRERFGLEGNAIELKARYNIAPTQRVPVVFNDGGRTLSEAKWGMEPGYAGGPMHFNARAESVNRKFRKDFEERRCLMLADSFYEWKHPEKKPYRVFLKDGGPFAFAGIYEERKERACCMITTSSNELIAKVHNRMPAILQAGTERGWLEADAEKAMGMLRPYPAGGMGMYEVSSKVNSARNDSPEVLEPKTSKGTLMEWMK